jgi:hypothetical protein
MIIITIVLVVLVVLVLLVLLVPGVIIITTSTSACFPGVVHLSLASHWILRSWRVKPFVFANMPGEWEGGRQASSRFWGRRGTQRLQHGGGGIKKQGAKRIMLKSRESTG